MHAAFRKDILRTIRGNLKRFVAIVVITILGTAMFSGLKAGCDDLRTAADDFYDSQQLFDMRVLSTLGITQDDVDTLAGIEGVAHAEGGYAETAHVKVAGERASVDVKALSDSGINEPYLVEGELPDSAGEVAVTRGYLKDSGASIGDTLTIEDAEDEANEVFERRDYTIVGAVIDPMEVNNAEGSMSFRAASSSDYAFFVTQDDVVADTFTVAYVRLVGADEILCYSDEYDDIVSQVTDRIDAVSDERAQARTNEVIGDALKQVEDGEREAQESFDEAERAFADGQKEIDDGRAELADGQAELDSGRQELIDGQAEIDANRQSLVDGQAQIDSGRSELESNRVQVEDGLAQIEAAQAEIDANRAALVEGRAELERQQALVDALPEQRAQLEKGKAELAAAKEAAEAEYVQSKAYLEQCIATLQAKLESLSEDDPEYAATQEALAQAQSGLALLESQYQEGMAEIAEQEQILAEQDRILSEAEAQAAEGAPALAEAWSQLESGEAQLESGQKELDAQRATLESAQQQLVDGQAQLDASQAQINDGWEQLNAGQAQIDSGWAEIESGQAELNDGAAELEDGQRELDEQRADYEREKADALAELADARAEVESIEPATWYIQDRSSLSGYSSIESDADSIEALGTAFPIIFLIVAILVSLTAITRLVEEQRGLIGTYKSLGFAKHQVYAKYLIYALSACIIGGIIGNVFGFVLLPLFLFTVFDVMYVLPGYPIVYNVASGVLGILLFVVAIGGSAFLSCRSEIHQTPADLLRPKVPKFGSRIFLERIRFVWKRLSFLNKVTARNLFRYKKRFFMTVAGIMGCTALIVCAFVIKDSVALMAPEQYESIDRYDIMAVVDADDLGQVAEDLSADGKVASLTRALVDSGEVGNGESTVDAQVIVVPDSGALEGYIAMADASGSPLELPDEGMLVTNNASQVLGLEQGGSAVLQDSSLEQRDALVAGVSQSYLGNYAYLSEEAYEDLFGAGAYEPNAVLVQLADGVDGPEFADELSQDSTYLSVVSTRELEDSFASSFQLINTVVAVILVMAAALAFVVLFTLSTTNISERERELATIKVLGFRRREVHHYVNKETLILTGIGIVFGLIAGPPLGGVLLGSLNMPGIAFPTHIEWYSMIICAVLPFAFALIVDAITNRTLDRIDMIGALKSVE